MIPSRNNRKGSLIIGVAALGAMLAIVCGSVLMRSLESYAATARAEQRMESRAAAEGATVLIAYAPHTRPADTDIGRCRIAFSPPDSASDKIDAPFRVDVMRSGPRPVLSEQYVARFLLDENGDWTLTQLEAVR